MWGSNTFLFTTHEEMRGVTLGVLVAQFKHVAHWSVCLSLTGVNTYHPTERVAVFCCTRPLSSLLIGSLLTSEHRAFKDKGSFTERQDRLEIGQAFFIGEMSSALTRKQIWSKHSTSTLVSMLLKSGLFEGSYQFFWIFCPPQTLLYG